MSEVRNCCRKQVLVDEGLKEWRRMDKHKMKEL